MPSLAENVEDLFAGRSDAHGSDTGGCVRAPPDYLAHVRGEHIGIYPMVPQTAESYGFADEGEGTHYAVCWGCVDIDIHCGNHPTYDYENEDDAHAAALQLVRVLHHLGIKGWVERTRHDGRHVWVFVAGWASAASVRRTLLVASQIAGTPTREVNPKQETLTAEQLGNYVRLPHPDHKIYAFADATIPFDVFVERALRNRSAPSVFEDAASLWQPPPTKKFLPHGWTHSNGAALAYPPYIHKLVTEGPWGDTDRSTWLARLAHKARAAGMEPDHAFLALLEADDLVGKFVGRRDRELRLQEMVQRAYS